MRCTSAEFYNFPNHTKVEWLLTIAKGWLHQKKDTGFWWRIYSKSGFKESEVFVYCLERREWNNLSLCIIKMYSIICLYISQKIIDTAVFLPYSAQHSQLMFLLVYAITLKYTKDEFKREAFNILTIVNMICKWRRLVLHIEINVWNSHEFLCRFALKNTRWQSHQ